MNTELFRKQLGINIRNHRQQIDMTLEQMAIKSNLSYKYVGSVERGQANISFDNIVLIANAIGIQPYKLFYFSENDVDSFVELEVLSLLKDVDLDTLNLIKNIIVDIKNSKK